MSVIALMSVKNVKKTVNHLSVFMKKKQYQTTKFHPYYQNAVACKISVLNFYDKESTKFYFDFWFII